MLLRIKKIMTITGLNQTQFSEKINMRQNNLSEILSGKRSIGPGVINKIVISLGVDLNWLITGEGNMFKSGVILSKEGIIGRAATEILEVKEETRPRIPLTAAAGSLSNMENGVTLADCEQLPIIHQFPSYDFTMFIKGDSMSPRYESGDEIACRKIDQARFVQWGKPHVLDTTQGIIIKKVYEDGNKLRCVSYNPNYADFSIPKEDIYSMSLVVGSLNISEM